MRPADKTPAGYPTQPAHDEAANLACQAILTPRRYAAEREREPLFIGSRRTIEGPIIGLRELRSVQPYIHSSYAVPADDVLAKVGIVFVYDMEEDARYKQLARCCEYRREHGGIHAIYAILRVPNVDLADRIVNELGAQFRFLGEASFGPAIR